MSTESGYGEKLVEIETLLKSSRQINDLEDHIENSNRTVKRNLLLDELESNMKLVEDSIENTIKLEGTSLDRIIINSKYRQTARNKLQYDYIIAPIPDNSILRIIETHGPYEHRLIDNKLTRITYYPEFKERYEKLVKTIKEHKMDVFLDVSSWKMLHMINGSFGELLKLIGVETGTSKTLQSLIGKVLPRLVFVEVFDSKGAPINGVKVKYYNRGWKALKTVTGEQGPGIITGLLENEQETVRIQVSVDGFCVEKMQRLSKNKVFTFTTLEAKVCLMESDMKTPIEGAEVRIFGDGWLGFGKGKTDNQGSVSMEILPGQWTINIVHNDASKNRLVSFSEENPIHREVTGKVYSMSHDCSHFVSFLSHPFWDGMELLSGDYVFKFLDEKKDFSTNIKSGMRHYIP